MFDLKDAEIKDEEAEMILQNRKCCHSVPRLLANLIRENKMVAISRPLSSILQTSLFADRTNTKEL